MRKVLVLGSLLLVAMLLVAACGDDDDDDDDDGGSSDSQATATATMDDNGDNAGDDDSADSDDGDDDSDDGDDGDDTIEVSGGDLVDYAEDLCTAVDDFVNGFPNLMLEPDVQSEIQTGDFSSLAEPIAALADELDDVSPPDALSEYHTSLVAYFQALAVAFQDGGPEAFARVEELANFPTPSAAQLADLEGRVDDIPACRDIGWGGSP